MRPSAARRDRPAPDPDGAVQAADAGFAPVVDGAFLPLATTLAAGDAAAARHGGARRRRFAAQFGLSRTPSAARRISSTAISTCICFRRCARRCSRRPAGWRRTPGCGNAAASCRCTRRLTDPQGPAARLAQPRFRARAARLGIATNPAFAGTYAFRAERGFRGAVSALPRRASAAALVMCHPGFVDAELERLDPLTTLREREYAYFCGDAFPEVLEAHGSDAELRPFRLRQHFIAVPFRPRIGRPISPARPRTGS